MQHLKLKLEKLEFKGELILKDIELTINRNDTIAIVGPNGAGKTSLMKVLTGENREFDGFLENIGNLKIGYLSQIYSDNEEKLVREELAEAFVQIQKIEKELKVLEEELSSTPPLSPSDSSPYQGELKKVLPLSKGELEGVVEKYSSLLEHFSHIGGYDYENKIHGVANGMGILDLLDKKLVEISGGQRTKVALAKVLLENPDILFLDEPTNFIDMHSVEWLEGYLKNKWNGGYVIISHDREFLDKTCNKTLEIQPQRAATMYHCKYSEYVIEREKIEKKKLEEFERQQEYVKEQEALINRFRAGSRAGWAKSREKMIDKIEKLEKPFIPKKPKFIFEYSGESSEKLFSYKEAFIGRQEPLFYIPDITMHAGMRIGVVGENGVGKSTFIKTILGQLDLLDGKQSHGKNVQILYYSQLHEELFKDFSIRENFKKHGLEYPDQYLIAILKHYLFEIEDLEKRVCELSGGQKSKLLFAILGQKESNLLIMDEPTNHLDYDTREALESALKKYEGSILFISHDRYFVNKIASHIWFIQDGELSVCYGNYEDYRFKIEHHLDMDMHLFDEDAELNLVLEEKLGEREFKRLKEKFGKGKKKRGK